jgi:hypothetical protein
MSQAELHLAAEAEEDRLLAERADDEVSAIHAQQQVESDEQISLSNAVDDDGAAAMQLTPSARESASTANTTTTSYVTAGLSFAIDCLGDEWAPADETSQQRQERHLKRAGICKIMELDNQLCAVRQLQTV